MGLATVNLLNNPEVWTVVELAGGVVSPGYCKWSGWKRHNQWDKKKGKGTRGSTQTLVQQPEAEGEFVFFIGYYTVNETPVDQYAAWDKFASLLKYDPTKKKPIAIGIYHPALDAIDVSSVVIEDVGAPEIVVEGDTLISITVKMSEFFPVPPQQSVGTPTTSQNNPPSPNAPGTQPAPAQDVYQQEIAALLQKAREP
jgi:hypothetical protein